MEIKINNHKVIQSNFLFLKSGIKLEQNVLEKIKGKVFLKDYIVIAKIKFKGYYFDILLKPISYGNYLYFRPVFLVNEIEKEKPVIEKIEVVFF